MATTIITKYGSGAPAASDVVRGELAVDTENKRLYTEDSGGSVVELGTNPAANVTFGDNVKAIFGAGSDLQIYHDGSASYISDQGTGNLKVLAGSFRLRNSADTENIMQGNENGTVSLYYDNSVKFATTSTGIDVTGTVTADGLTSSGNIFLDGSGNPSVINKTSGAGNNPIYRLQADTNYWDLQGTFSNTNDELFFMYNGSTKMAITSAGNVGIGNTSPATALDVTGTVTATDLTLSDGTNPTLTITDTTNTTTLSLSAGNLSTTIGTTTNHPLTFDTNDTERLRIDSSGNVGIGTTSITNVQTPTLQLGTNRGAIAIGTGDIQDDGSTLDISAARPISFTTSSTERMRIDSSGNLLVGKTSAGINGEGFEAVSSGYIAAVKDGGTAAYFQRKTSDGEIVNFRKDGTTVGSIGTISGQTFIDLKPGSGGAGFRGGNAKIVPYVNSADADNTVDIGATAVRFKDLYLSGGVFVDGDGSSRTEISSSTVSSVVYQDLGGFTGTPSVARGIRFLCNDASTAKAERMRLDKDGNLLVGTTDTSLYNNTSGEGFSVVNSELGVAKSDTCAYFNRMGSDGTTVKFFNRGGNVGNISTTSSATAYNTSSDYRLKENVVAMSGATERLKQLKPSRFNFIADPNKTVDGFLAHEVQDIVPEAITGTKDAVDAEGNPEYQGIDQSKLIPLLVATIQELEARIAQLEGES